MGRSIPSISYRTDAKVAQWKRLAGVLRGKDKKAFDELLELTRSRRTEIDAADEADVTSAILLLAILNLLGRIPHDGPKNGQSRLE